jgi:aminoglycoside phosphotransferase (APT) family kinase protein
MDTGKILAELRGERDRISQAITALEALHNTPSTGRKSPGRPKGATTTAPKRRKGLTAAGRKRLSEMMKKRWAERKKAAKPKGRGAAA